ncbi:excinuclease ABC subunit C [Elizabethkingia anophelis]|nr:excinuclease ABC subunit C [Elizabethkingia anophelis]
MCFCYILYSSTLNQFYIGHCSEELNERLRKHLSNHKGFTSRAKDWIIVYSEAFNDKSSAYKKRTRNKKHGRVKKKIEQLIKKLDWIKHSDFNRNGHRFESCRAHFKKPLQKCKGFFIYI